ncbi:hypothetical protein pqer_cds_274 [Pandoravirus quercus]|uniref:Uncharacterized protein n=2 Tax=Pandoravirus TaxID=2060084 RepID=A0A2U7U8E0_9VIRU|nr:hypothetical protein pqer_cds_274 [Pandoravirus quercus]AVK74696.1 hypothetical protein pqer_cds_274 [Pandoravirus quercus]QBZ80873.1 hypothetical protein pclt_cds_275 [Pandoravirus celtis]
MQDNNNDNSAQDNGGASEARPARRPLAVRKPKPTAGWANGAAATEATATAGLPAVPLPLPSPQQQQPQQQLPPHTNSARGQSKAGQGKAGQSAAERSSDLRSAYRARMAAMRTSRVGGTRRQARHMAEPEPEPEIQTEETDTAPAGDILAPPGQANALPQALHLSRSQRKRLARSARSPAVLDAALARAGIANPASRAALADAIAAGVGSGDGAIGERVTRALAS